MAIDRGQGIAISTELAESFDVGGLLEDAEAAKVAAQVAQAAAEVAETNAETAETNAETAEANASSSSSSANASATSATASAASAGSSATDAQSSEDDAETSATASAASASASSSSASAASTSASTAATQAGIATTKASEASTSATNAATSLSTFQGQYVSQASAPSSPSVGDLWFDTTASIMKVYTGTSFANAGSSVNGVENSVEHTATAGQTSFTATYDVGYLNVFLNGVKLDSTDYTATNGSTVVLDTGATVGDSVFIQSFGTFELADHYSKVDADARYAQTVNHYTKTEGDARYEPIDSAYTKAEDDARFLGLAGGTMTGDVSLGDSVKANFGASDDLQIYHDGTKSYVDDTGTGNLVLRGNSAVSLQKYTGETLAVFNADGAVNLYHDNALKLATTSTGINVTGSVTCDKKVIIEGTDTGNPVNAVVDSMRVSGYGIQANRGAMFLTNAATDGLIHIGNSGAHNSNILASFTSNGLTFNRDTAAANALDDYEEGTWTPTFSGSVGFSTQLNFTYTKIGRVVTITGYLSGQTGTLGSTFNISGLPYPANGDYNMARLWTHGTSYGISCYMVNGGYSLNIREQANATMTSIPEMSVQMTYVTN